MINKIGVTIICENEAGKTTENYIETDTLLSATRIMNTFKPKRGYKAKQFLVKEVTTLF